MVVILPAKRVTHLIAGRDRAAEIAPGVVCIEGHQVTSIDTLTEFGVVVEKFDSTDTIEVSPSQLQRAEALERRKRNESTAARPGPPLAILGPGEVLVGHQACLGHGGGHTTWTCRTCDQTVYGPPLNTHCTCLDGPAAVRISTQRR